MSEIRITSTELGDAATSETGGQVRVTSFDGGNGIVQSVVAGTNVTVDSTDPAHPVVSATGGGGGGAVDSVNGHTGVVVLAATDVGADATGAAAAVLVTAEGYTDTAVAGEVTRANAAYDAAGAAATAQAAAVAASQPLDADLTAIAALSTTSFGRALLTLADAAALRTTAGLGTAALSATGDFDAAGAAAAAQAAAIAAAATDATTKANAAAAASQPLDSDLTAIAALTTTSYGRAFLALADAAAGRTALGLGTAATSATTAFDAAGAAAAAQAASQPLDSDLTSIAALTTTTYGRAFLALADAAAGRTALGLGTAATSASTDFQPVDSDLTAIAALTTTSFGRSFLALADAAAGRTLLGLGTLATQSGTFSGTSSGTNTGDQTITLTGDVTGSGTGSFAATLASTAVTPGSYTSTNLTVDAKGRITAAANGSGGGGGAGLPSTIVSKTTTYTAAAGDFVEADTSAGGFTVTLPSAPSAGTLVAVKKVSADANTLTIVPTGAGTIDGDPNATTITQWAGAIFEHKGSNVWRIASVMSYGAGSSTPILGPTGAIRETYGRHFWDGNTQLLASGSLYLSLIPLVQGDVVSNITFYNAVSMTGQSHWWFALFNSSFQMLAVTADQTTTGWTSGTSKATLPIATVAAGAASSFTATYTGAYYLGVMVAASGTKPNLNAKIVANSVMTQDTPILGGLSTTALTTPPAFPFTASAPALSGFSLPYAYVS